MNKNLFRLGGAILTFEALFIIVLIFPVIVKAYAPGSGLQVLLVVVGTLLLLASGIGGLLAKKWSVITLWIGLVISFIFSVSIGHQFPSFVGGNFISWVTDLIIAIFLTIESRASRV